MRQTRESNSPNRRKYSGMVSPARALLKLIAFIMLNLRRACKRASAWKRSRFVHRSEFVCLHGNLLNRKFRCRLQSRGGTTNEHKLHRPCEWSSIDDRFFTTLRWNRGRVNKKCRKESLNAPARKRCEHLQAENRRIVFYRKRIGEKGFA